MGTCQACAGRARMRYLPAEECSTLTADMIRYQSLVVNGADGKQQRMCIMRAREQLEVISTISHKDAFNKHVTIANRDVYFEVAGGIIELDEGQLANLVEQTEKHLALA
eukprot:1860510-Pyramimonas_sp.AAC.2